MNKTGTSPDRDASLGLIFRMNNLWAKVDEPAESGDYDAWNNVLDRIFANLDYKVDYDVKTDDDGKVIDVTMNSEHDNKKDERIHSFFSSKIAEAKRAVLHSKKNKERAAARGRWYKLLMKKDIWLRKMMMKRGLYLKEVEHSPGSSLFGSFGSKKK